MREEEEIIEEIEGETGGEDKEEYSVKLMFPVESARFKMKSLKFFLMLLTCVEFKLIVSIVLVAIPASVLVIAGIKGFIVCLMFIFIVYPMAIAFMYYYYGLNKYCYFNVVPHSLTICPECVSIRMYFPVHDDDKGGEGQTDVEDDGKGMIEMEKTCDLDINYSRFGRYKVYGEGVVFPIIVNRHSKILKFFGARKKVEGFMWFPKECIDEEGLYSLSVEYIAKSASKSRRIVLMNQN